MYSTYLNLSLCLALSLTFSSKIYSQNSDNQESHYNDFDFWIGTWDVYKYGTDTIVGLSEISPILNHKTIEEKYQSLRYPYEGTSNNIYNVAKKRWEQYWVDNSGLALHIVGGIEDEKMILSSCDANNCNKIIWTPIKDGSVRQEWFQSTNNRMTWNKIFDGHYKPQGSNLVVKPVLGHLKEYSNIRDFTLSSGGEEAYVTVQNPTDEIRTICRMTKTNGVWSKPNPTSFSGVYKDLEPYFSPDNSRLYFASNRPNSFEKENYDIYYVERDHKDSLWSKPKNIGHPVNTEADEFYPSIASSGNLYFTCVKPHNKGFDDIYLSVYKDLKYFEPIALDSSINTLGYEFNSFVAPDESYIIFSGYNRDDGKGSGDLYISHKSTNGNWSKAENIGDNINSKYMDYCPFVDTNTGTLYFTSRRNINNKQPIKSNLELEREILKYQNGSSRIYKVKLK